MVNPSTKAEVSPLPPPSLSSFSLGGKGERRRWGLSLPGEREAMAPWKGEGEGILYTFLCQYNKYTTSKSNTGGVSVVYGLRRA